MTFYSRTIARKTMNANDSVARWTVPYSLLNRLGRHDRGAGVPVRGRDESLLIQIMKCIHRVFVKRTTRRFHALQPRDRARQVDADFSVDFWRTRLFFGDERVLWQRDCRENHRGFRGIAIRSESWLFDLVTLVRLKIQKVKLVARFNSIGVYK